MKTSKSQKISANDFRKIIKSLAVTNDHAERSVALVLSFSGRLTKEKEQLQYLLQVVSQHRKDFCKPPKNALL